MFSYDLSFPWAKAMAKKTPGVNVRTKKKNADVWSFAEGVLASAVAVALGSAVLRDARIGGLGTSNGRIVSFLASLNSVAGFRRQKRAVGADGDDLTRTEKRKRLGRLHSLSPGTSRLKAAGLFALQFGNKYGAQTVGSLLVGATPVLLKGPRHLVSWLLAFCAVQLAPADVVYDAVTRHAALTLVVKVGAALYKLRKFNFVVGACEGCTVPLMILAQIVVIDGNNLCSRLSTWCWLRRFRFDAADARRGLRAVLQRVVPITCAAMLVRCCGMEGFLVVTDPRITYSMRVAVLCVFLNRNDVAALAAKTLRACLRAVPDEVAIISKPPLSPLSTPCCSPVVGPNRAMPRLPSDLNLKQD